MSLKDKFRAAQEKRLREDVTALLPADVLAGEKVYARGMSSDDADDLERSNHEEKRSSNGRSRFSFRWRGARARYCAFCLAGEDGTRIFDPADAADVAILSDLPRAIMEPLYAACKRVNGELDEKNGDDSGNPEPPAA